MVGRRFAGRLQGGMRRDLRYVAIAPVAVAAATMSSVSIVTAKDSPNDELVSDGTNVAEIQSNSVIRAIRLTWCVSSSAVLTDPLPVRVGMYRLKEGATAPADSNFLFDRPDTEIEMSQHKNLMFIKAFYLTPTFDCHEIHTRPVQSRHALLQEGDAIRIFIHNREAATDSIEHFVEGRILYTMP